MQELRVRRAARLLVISPQRTCLLFRFRFQQGALAGQDYWATPGGGVEPGESWEQAALRELYEETGIICSRPGPQVAFQRIPLVMANGERVLADERFWLIEVEDTCLDNRHWTAHEREVMVDYRWWPLSELATTAQSVWPKGIAAALDAPRGCWPLDLQTVG